MTLLDINIKPLVAAMVAASVLTACGGGGGGGGGTQQGDTTTVTPGGSDTGGSNNGGNNGGGNNDGGGTTTPSQLSMVCPEGAASGVQCSGDAAIQTDNGVVLTASGVQVLARTTNDLDPNVSVPGGARGFALADKGLAEIRINKSNAATAPTAPVVLLKDLGLSWDNSTERPQIIETFRNASGRVELAANRTINAIALPAASDTSFYNFFTLGAGATQANYANNTYYPRCADGTTTCANPQTELGTDQKLGNYRLATTSDHYDPYDPDYVSRTRLHNDGDIHAGGVAANGTFGSTLPGPGSKGYRSLVNLSYADSNLGLWETEDTVRTVEWASVSGDQEHTTGRRGAVAFGNVTDPAAVPTTGTATYVGIIHGAYAATPTMVNPDPVRGRATVTVDFAARTATVTFANVATFDAQGTAVPLAFSTTVTGATGNFANYLTGAVSANGFTGGISARYFGQVVNTGTTAGPAEIGGTLRLTNASGAVFIGGFIGRKN